MADKTNSIFRALDRKAAAITEFTMRQYRTKISTWVVLVTGMIVTVSYTHLTLPTIPLV